MDEAEGRRREAGIGVWLDGYAKGGATTQPPPLLQTPQLPGTATARPEVTRLLPTMHLRPSVYPSFHLSILHPSIRSPLRLLPFVSRSVPTHPPFLPLLSPTLSFTCACTWWFVTSSLPSCTRTSEDSWRIV